MQSREPPPPAAPAVAHAPPASAAPPPHTTLTCQSLTAHDGGMAAAGLAGPASMGMWLHGAYLGHLGAAASVGQGVLAGGTGGSVSAGGRAQGLIDAGARGG